MKVIQVHNRYRLRGGECVYVDSLTDLMRRKGVDVFLWTKDSGEIGNALTSKISAFISGIYSRTEEENMSRIISRFNPDIVHIHNVYPLFSPSILIAARRAGVSVVMTCHNFRLVCPVGTHFQKKGICERCLRGREYWCVFNNCRQNFFESLALALRNWVARKGRFFTDNVNTFIAVSTFLKKRLCQEYLPESRISVLPNMITLHDCRENDDYGAYVAFAGRISPEKGISVFLAAMSKNPELPGRIAGDYSSCPDIAANAPKNIKFAGHLHAQQLQEFYRQARFLVVPSLCYETFGLAAAEAMSYGIPVIASRIGALPDLIEDGISGLLFKPGDVVSLSEKIKYLWDNPAICRRMGQAARDKIKSEYSEDVIFTRLMKIYEGAITLNEQERAVEKKR